MLVLAGNDERLGRFDQALKALSLVQGEIEKGASDTKQTFKVGSLPDGIKVRSETLEIPTIRGAR